MKKEVVLGQRYEVLSKIGTGGMADVYKGRDTMLNRFIAIKVLKKEYREDEAFVRKFRSEAQAAAGLMHPNIVNVYDVGEDRGLHYMTMELVEGITLKSYVDKKGALSSREVISIAIQMCAGIEAAHQHNIIHRDIKPQNIMISKDGKVKVTDFGIARATTSHTVSSNAMGSVHYTSPEQARGDISDAKSDIYSVGITLYEMITGELPFDGDSTVSIAIKHLQEEITPPSEHVSDIPYSLEQIILKCTLKSADRRYASIPELVQDLKRSLVDPNGNFVKFSMYPNNDETIMMTSDELSEIQAKYQNDFADEYDDEEDELEDVEYFDDEEDDEELDEYDDEEEDEKDGKVNPRMNKVMKVLTIVVAAILILVLVLIVGNAAGWFKFNDGVTATNENMVIVPGVVGETEEKAKQILKDADLTSQVVTRKESSEYEEGIVIEQKIAEGEEVAKQTLVQLVVSSGKTDDIEEKKIPDVSGLDEDTAYKKLKGEGFTNINRDYKNSSIVSNGKVIETDPASGQTVALDKEITIWISTGEKKADKVTIPASIIGKSQAEVKASLENLGLVVISTPVESDKQAGIVVACSPGAGSSVEVGSTVTISYSDGSINSSGSEVPNLIGQWESNAKSLIQGAGMKPGKVTYEYSNDYQKGVIMSQTPSAGKADAGTTVNYVVSKGPQTANSDTGTGEEE